MTELPDFTGYEPVELSQVKQGDVLAAVLAGTIAHGAVTYTRKDSVDLDSGFNTTDKGDYKFFRAPKQLPTGDCAVIEYNNGSVRRKRALLMGGSWFLFDVWTADGDDTTWDHPDIELGPDEMAAETKSGFTTIFEGVKK